MPTITTNLHTPLLPSFRTAQVAGLFDVPLGERLSHTLTAELPGLEEEWTIGAIVGPSGSGKTTLARAAYGAIYEPEPWPVDAAVIDALEELRNADFGLRIEDGVSIRNPQSEVRNRPLPLKSLTRLLTAVGLGSVPAWLKPYHVLSTGERFRADVARAILNAGTSFNAKPKAPAPRDLTTPNGCASGYALNETRAEQGGDSFNPKPKATAPRDLTTPNGCASGYALNEIAGPAPLILDEFTSPLDRTVACTASAAIGKLLRKYRESGARSRESAESCIFVPPTPECRPLTPDSRPPAPPRLVVLSCHTDFLPWLAPDWVLDLGRSPPQLARGSLQRPTLRLAVRRVPQALWPLFARHHYLAGGLSSAATCYAAFWDDRMHDSFNAKPKATVSGDVEPADTVTSGSPLNEPSPIAFCAVVAALGWKGRKRITRLVTLPEFQGLGIGPKLAEIVAQHQTELGHRVSITASHPAILGHCARSPRWKYTGLKKTGSTRQQYGARLVACSTGRAVASFEFVREAEARDSFNGEPQATASEKRHHHFTPAPSASR